MAIAVEMNFPGATLENYDQVMAMMGLTPGGSGPPGAISHWAAATADGLRVVDVWETQAQFDAFARAQLGPFTQRPGFTSPPHTPVYEVSSYLTPASG